MTWFMDGLKSLEIGFSYYNVTSSKVKVNYNIKQINKRITQLE